MRSEALDAFATQSTRPGALEAATAKQGDHDTTETRMTNESNTVPTRPALNRLITPFGQHTDGTESAAKAVEGVVEGVKAVVHEAVVWTEKKAEELARTEDHAGPYDSPATASGGVSDLDVIATGVLPATVPAQEDGKDEESCAERSQGEGQMCKGRSTFTMASSKHPLLLAAAVTHAVLSLGHTTKGLEQFKHASISALPTALRGAVKAGWYEGSGFFLMMCKLSSVQSTQHRLNWLIGRCFHDAKLTMSLAILNYKWAQTGLLDIYDKSIAGLLVAILAGAAANYFQSGDKPTAGTLAVAAVLQGLAAKGAAL
ncbi:hypothetical protein SVAN01_01989 [Stagonosporopsis vannaccii]|nr:hypothetical protein SVAN01_01989 [Stagonosporopsis vannaccii]